MSKVIYYRTAYGENPVSDFLDSLQERQQAKLLRIVTTIEKYGLQSIFPHVKKLIGTPLWEIRILGKDNLRVLYVVMNGNDILLIHGFVKKVQKTPQREINIAMKRLQEWQAGQIDK